MCVALLFERFRGQANSSPQKNIIFTQKVRRPNNVQLASVFKYFTAIAKRILSANK